MSQADIKEREYWDDYQKAFEDMVNNTSSEIAPWYVVPADHKWYARYIVSEIVRNTLQQMNPEFPKVDDSIMKFAAETRQQLLDSIESQNEGAKLFLNKKEAKRK